MTDRSQNTDMLPDVRRRLRPASRVLWTLVIVLAAVDVVHHRHGAFRLEEFPAFYGLFAVISCTVLVLGARVLRALARRRESYYDG